MASSQEGPQARWQFGDDDARLADERAAFLEDIEGIVRPSLLQRDECCANAAEYCSVIARDLALRVPDRREHRDRRSVNTQIGAS